MDNAADKDFFGGQKGKALGEVKPDLPAEDAFQFYACRMGNFPLPVIQYILQKIQILVFRMIFIGHETVPFYKRKYILSSYSPTYLTSSLWMCISSVKIYLCGFFYLSYPPSPAPENLSLAR